MKSTKSFLRKEDITVNDLVTSGGYLPASTAKKFIKRLIRKSKLTKMMYVEMLSSHTQSLPNIAFDDDILQVGVSGQALSENERSKPSIGNETWTTQLWKGEVRIPYEVLEDNVEGQKFKNTILNEAIKRIGPNIEKIVIRSDTTSGATPALQLIDGIVSQATSNVVNASQSRLTPDVLRNLIRALPKQYLDDKANLKLLTSINAEDDFRDIAAARVGTEGDKQFKNADRVFFKGIEIVPIPLFPEDLGAGTNETVCILTNPKNIGMGWWRKLKVRQYTDESADSLVTVFSLRFDARYLVEDAVSMSDEIVNS